MILSHKPITQATELYSSAKGALHALAFLISDVELLILYQKLCARSLTRLDSCIRLIAHTRKAETILKTKINYN